MKQATAEWIDRAEGDWQVAGREQLAALPVWNVVCFLAQQCAEKHLKAYLEECAIPFGKTHDLTRLLDLMPGRVPELDALRPQLAYLTPFAVASRYPGIPADAKAGGNTIAIAGQVRVIVRGKLGLP
jgi:HEPN domain-containing protein